MLYNFQSKKEGMDVMNQKKIILKKQVLKIL